MGKRWCDVTVETPDGKRHTITVESASVYEARDGVLRALRSDIPRRQLTVNEQGHGLRSAADLPRDSEAADGVGEQESGTLRPLEEAPEVPMTLRGAEHLDHGAENGGMCRHNGSEPFGQCI